MKTLTRTEIETKINGWKSLQIIEPDSYVWIHINKITPLKQLLKGEK